MKKIGYVLMLLLVFGCSDGRLVKSGSTSGVGIVFDGTPLIFDQSVGYMGTIVGQVADSQWSNGVTRLIVSFNQESQHLITSNMAAVVKNGRLNLVPLTGIGQPLADQTCLLGFRNSTSLQWFKFKNLINNINMAAARQAQWLLSLSGLSG